MSEIRTQVQVLMKLQKIKMQREALMKKNAELVKKERSFVSWLANLEGSAFRCGDMVMIDGDNPQTIATVRYLKKDKRGTLWVFLTTTDGRKTRRVPRNLRRLGNI